MSNPLVFSEETLLNGNIFKFEQRLKSHTQRFVENGAILTQYWNISENATTVQRGTQDIKELFGKSAPIRYNMILDFPLYGFGQANPTNTDELAIEDINIEGECIMLPATIVPNPNDFFILNHLKRKGVNAIFQVTEVTYDSMKVEGYYKIRYRLHSTSESIIQELEQRTVGKYHTDLNAVGSNVNPIISEDNFIKRGRIEQMLVLMIRSYRALFYNEKHNCFLFFNQDTGDRLFDICGNEFIAKYSLMNPFGANDVIMLHKKINDRQLPVYYNNSIYNWLEMGAPLDLIQKFHFQLSPAIGYTDSSFARWSENDIQVIQPLATYQVGIHNQDYSFFDGTQFEAFMQTNIEPRSEFDKLLWKYINKPDSISIEDVSLNIANVLINSNRHIDVFLYTPIVIYIIRQILRMN